MENASETTNEELALMSIIALQPKHLNCQGNPDILLEKIPDPSVSEQVSMYNWEVQIECNKGTRNDF